MSLDDTQVELILQAAQTVAIGINQRNIIVLADKGFPPACRRPGRRPE